MVLRKLTGKILTTAAAAVVGVSVAACAVPQTNPAATESVTATTEAVTESSTEANAEAATTETTQVRKRRTLPHKEVSSATEASTEAETAEPEEPGYTYPNSVDEIKTPLTLSGPSVMFHEKKDVKEDKITKKGAAYPDSEEDMEEILNAMAGHWEQGDMEAVNYLARMEKYMYLSQMLEGSPDYFYVGDVNENGEPEGTGLACYADNAYYYGEFKNGLRSGKGFWYQIFKEGGNYSQANNGIIGHSYQGMWDQDLPNGEGQEHLDIDTAYLKERVVTNVLTKYEDGYYNGTITATTLDTEAGMVNWTGEARFGMMVVIGDEATVNKDGEKEVRVLENVDQPQNYYWMLEAVNEGQGITGLIAK